MTPKEISIGGRTKVHPQEVIALVASVNYSIAYMHNGNIIMVATTLKKLEGRFDPTVFVRTHKSFLINLQFVADFKSEQNIILMKNELQVEVSRRKKAIFQCLLGNYLQ